jgi:hypothetical protein
MVLLNQFLLTLLKRDGNMRRNKKVIKNLFTTLIVFLWIAGCASTRYIAKPSQPPPDCGLQCSVEGIEAKLHYIITPDGPGSWIKKAIWNEWVISVRNSTKSDVTITDISLIDPRGVYVDSNFRSLRQLQLASSNALQCYKDLTVSLAVQGFALEAARQAYTVGGSTAQAFAGGLVDIADPLVSAIGEYRKEQDQKSIEAEFQKRCLICPFRLSADGYVRGSAFFPMVPRGCQIFS